MSSNALLAVNIRAVEKENALVNTIQTKNVFIARPLGVCLLNLRVNINYLNNSQFSCFYNNKNYYIIV